MSSGSCPFGTCPPGKHPAGPLGECYGPAGPSSEPPVSLVYDGATTALQAKVKELEAERGKVFSQALLKLEADLATERAAREQAEETASRLRERENQVADQIEASHAAYVRALQSELDMALARVKDLDEAVASAVESREYAQRGWGAAETALASARTYAQNALTYLTDEEDVESTPLHAIGHARTELRALLASHPHTAPFAAPCAVCAAARELLENVNQGLDWYRRRDAWLSSHSPATLTVGQIAEKHGFEVLELEPAEDGDEKFTLVGGPWLEEPDTAKALREAFRKGFEACETGERLSPNRRLEVAEQKVLDMSAEVHTIVLETLVQCGSQWPRLVKWAGAALELKQSRRVADHRLVAELKVPGSEPERRVAVDGFGFLDVHHLRKSLARAGWAIVPSKEWLAERADKQPGRGDPSANPKHPEIDE